MYASIFQNRRFSKKSLDYIIILSSGTSTNTLTWRALVVGLMLLVAGSAMPVNSWAALLEGVRFIDNPPLATQPENSFSEPKYTVDGFIIFKPLNSPGLSTFSTPVISGDYSVLLSDGDYKVWQYVDPATLDATEISQVQWANETDALEITVSGSTITWTGTTISATEIDFPFPSFIAKPIPAALTACNISDPSGRKIICDGIASPPSGFTCTDTYSTTSWPTTSNQYENDRVFIYGDIVVSSGMTVKVKSLCNYGTLSSEVSKDIEIEFTDIFANFEDGNVIAENATVANLPGSSIKLEGTSPTPPGVGGIVFNEGTIKAGNAFTHVIDSSTATTFEQSQSVGGNIDIIAANTYQYGNLFAGQGSEIRFEDFWDAWEWEHQAGDAIFDDNNTMVNLPTPSSKGGHTIINQGVVITGNQSATSAGNGGAIVIVNNDDCGNNPEQNPSWCINEIEGGAGGNLELLVTSGTITNTALKGNSVYVEPETIEISDGTTITADEDIVIFGGDDYLLKMTGLGEGAISAGRDIILAVGEGGTIDLRGISTKAFKAVGTFEIHADSILLDDGVQLEDIVEAQEIIIGPSQILYHVALSGNQQVSGEPNSNVPINLVVYNGGPEVDTYTLAINSENGWAINGLPSSITVNGLEQVEVTLNVALPTEGNDTITVTAISQADPDVSATFELRVTILQEKCATPATYDSLANTVTIQKLDVPVLSPLTGKPTGNVAVFEAKLQQVPGVSDFQLVPDSLIFLSMSTEFDPNNARFEWNDGMFNTGGKLAMCVAVPGVIVVNGMKFPTDPVNYLVSMKTLAVEQGVFHIDTITPEP